ncbi:MAG: hypothetical protein WD081_03735 [Gammaproteobacteria bacterium]
MEALLWGSGILVMTLLLWKVLKVVVGVGVPLEISGRALLIRELADRGVNARMLPTAMLDELVDHATHIAKFRHGDNAVLVKSEAVEIIEYIADMLCVWIESADNEIFHDEMGRPPIVEIFARYL